MSPLSSANTTDRSALVKLVPGDVGRGLVTTPANEVWTDDIVVVGEGGGISVDADGEENPLEAPDAGSTTAESIGN